MCQWVMTEHEQSCQPGTSKGGETWVWFCPLRCHPVPMCVGRGSRVVALLRDLTALAQPTGTGGFGEHGDTTARWPKASWQGANRPGSCTVFGRADATRLCPPQAADLSGAELPWGAAGRRHPLPLIHPLTIIWLNKTLQYNLPFLKTCWLPLLGLVGEGEMPTPTSPPPCHPQAWAALLQLVLHVRSGRSNFSLTHSVDVSSVTDLLLYLWARVSQTAWPELDTPH